MINQADRGGDGEISIDEFYRIMKKKGNFLEDLSSDDDFYLRYDKISSSLHHWTLAIRSLLRPFFPLDSPHPSSTQSPEISLSSACPTSEWD